MSFLHRDVVLSVRNVRGQETVVIFCRLFQAENKLDAPSCTLQTLAAGGSPCRSTHQSLVLPWPAGISIVIVTVGRYCSKNSEYEFSSMTEMPVPQQGSNHFDSIQT